MNISDMNEPCIGLHFDEVVIYDNAGMYKDSRVAVIKEDGSVGWCKPGYIDYLCNYPASFQRIKLAHNDQISWTSSETGQTVTGRFVTHSEHEEPLIIVEVTKASEESIPITRTEDHGTVTFRGPHFALDLTNRPDEVVRSGWHSALDDDPAGIGVTTRLHAYGKERLLEIKLLVEQGLEEIEKQQQGRG